MCTHAIRVRNMFGCCQARSELENAHTNVSQLVRSAELRLRDGFEGFAAVFATDPGIELVRALCFLVYSALKDEKKVVYVENLLLAPVGCVQKSRYVWTHHLKS